MEIWIALLVVVAALSGWAGYFWASRGAPKRAELEALAAELDEARRRADAVQTGVDEHFEQSARLFGKLAGDYREFLEHFAGSAQALGLSESRTRELVQQSFQPLLTHEVDDLVVAAEAGTGTPAPSEDSIEPVAEQAAAPQAEATAADGGEAVEGGEATPKPARVAEVTLTDEAEDAPSADRTSADTASAESVDPAAADDAADEKPPESAERQRASS